MKILYTAEATSEGGRYEARASSSDGRLSVDIEPPPELGGPEDARATNPEQLLAAGWAACFHSAIKTIAGMKEIDLSESHVRSKVHLGVLEGKGIGLSGEIHVSLPGMEAAEAEKLVRRAHRRCPFSNALKGGMAMEVHLDGRLLPDESPAPAA